MALAIGDLSAPGLREAWEAGDRFEVLPIPGRGANRGQGRLDQRIRAPGL